MNGIVARRGRCNRCQLEDITRVAQSAGGHVEVRLRGDKLPEGLEKQEQYSGPRGLGFDLFIVYPSGPAWSCWVSHLEVTCWCKFNSARDGQLDPSEIA